MNRNEYIVIQEYAFKNVVCKMAAILFPPQCVKFCSFDIILEMQMQIAATH